MKVVIDFFCCDYYVKNGYVFMLGNVVNDLFFLMIIEVDF